MSQKQEISYSQEILRKSIHLCSLSIPIVSSFIDKFLALEILLPITAAFVIIDLLSHIYAPIGALVQKFFGKMLRPHEYSKTILLNGASWVLLSACLCLFIFPKIAFVVGFSTLIISDISAALFGRKFGKHKFFDKSLEGSSAFFISALIVMSIIGYLSSMPWIFFAFGALGALLGAIVEAASITLRFDDNFSIPLTVGAVMVAGGMVADKLSTPFLYLLR